MERAQDVTALTWEGEVTQSAKLTVVYFWHEPCPWCLGVYPIFSQVVEEYKERMKFVKLNILEAPSNRQIADNHGVLSIPTLLFL